MADHLFKTENETIIVRDNFDEGYDRKGVENALIEMQLYTRQTKGNTGIFSVAISPSENDKLTPEQRARAIEIIEEKFGLQNQVKVQIDHVKDGRAHSHLLWSVVNQEEGKLIRLNNYKRRLQTCSTEMEQEFNLEQVRRTPDEMTVEVSHADRMRQGKHKKCQHRKQEISAVWNSTDTAEDFLMQVRGLGYGVAKGDRSAFVLIDHDGKVYNLVRELPKMVKTKDVRMRFGEIELSSIAEVKALRLYDREQETIDRQNRELAAADEAAQSEKEERSILKKRFDQKANDKQQREASQKQPSEEGNETYIRPAYEVYDRNAHIDRTIDHQRREAEKRIKERKVDRQRIQQRLKELRNKIKPLRGKTRRSKKYKQLLQEEENLQKTLANSNQRIEEAERAEEIKRAALRAKEEKNYDEKKDRDVINLAAAKKAREQEAFRKMLEEEDRKKQQRERDRDSPKF